VEDAVFSSYGFPAAANTNQLNSRRCQEPGYIYTLQCNDDIIIIGVIVCKFKQKFEQQSTYRVEEHARV
jgi:hypothetical protein